MKKNNVIAEFVTEIEKLTKEQVYDLLEEKVTAINEGIEDDDLRIKTDAECKELCKRYNELSMLTIYGICVKAKYPVLSFAQTYYFPTIKTTDKLTKELDEDTGKERRRIMRSIEEGEKRLDLFHFLEWAEGLNKKVTADKHWRVACNATRNSIESEWKKVFKSDAKNNEIGFGTIKKNLQEMYNALLFIPSEKGNNRVMATGAVARYLFGFANTRKDSRTKEGDIKITKSVLSTKQWVTLVLDALHETVKDKDYAPKDLGLEYGSDEEDKDGGVTVTKATAEDMAK